MRTTIVAMLLFAACVRGETNRLEMEFERHIAGTNGWVRFIEYLEPRGTNYQLDITFAKDVGLFQDTGVSWDTNQLINVPSNRYVCVIVYSNPPSKYVAAHVVINPERKPR